MSAANAEEPGRIDKSFDPAPKSCAEIQWSDSVLNRYPDISDACQSIQMRNGKTFAMLEGTVEDVENHGQKLTVDFKDGGELTLNPKPSTTLYVDGERTTFADLREGAKLNFYIPEDRFQAEFPGATGSAPTVIVPIFVWTPAVASAGDADNNDGMKGDGMKTSSGDDRMSSSSMNMAPSSAMTPASAGFAQGAESSNQNRMADQSSQDPRQSNAAGAQAKASGNGPVVVLVPVDFAADTSLAGGCWARLYDSENFNGNMLTLVGPVDIARTQPVGVTGFEFGPNYDSVKVGPNATLRVWDDVGYESQAATFTSGQSVTDLTNKLGALEDIESLKVSCKN